MPRTKHEMALGNSLALALAACRRALAQGFWNPRQGWDPRPAITRLEKALDHRQAGAVDLQECDTLARLAQAECLQGDWHRRAPEDLACLSDLLDQIDKAQSQLTMSQAILIH